MAATPPVEQKPRYSPTPTTASTEEGNLGSRLLKKRRERDDD
jgi:hypothetical protein